MKPPHFDDDYAVMRTVPPPFSMTDAANVLMTTANVTFRTALDRVKRSLEYLLTLNAVEHTPRTGSGKGFLWRLNT